MILFSDPIVDTFFRENKNLFTAEEPIGIFTSGYFKFLKFFK